MSCSRRIHSILRQMEIQNTCTQAEIHNGSMLIVQERKEACKPLMSLQLLGPRNSCLGNDGMYVSPKKCRSTSLLGFLRGREGEAGHVRQGQINRETRGALVFRPGYLCSLASSQAPSIDLTVNGEGRMRLRLMNDGQQCSLNLSLGVHFVRKYHRNFFPLVLRENIFWSVYFAFFCT